MVNPLICWRYLHPARLELRVLQLLVVGSGRSYAVTATVPAVSFDQYDQLVRGPFQSFSLV